MDQWSIDEWTNRVELPPSPGAGQSVLPIVSGAKGHEAELRGQGLALRIENLQHLALVSKVRALARACGAWDRAAIAVSKSADPPRARPRLLRPRYTRSAGQVCTELEIHVGVGDKTLAEFIINLAGPCARLRAKRGDHRKLCM